MVLNYLYGYLQKHKELDIYNLYIVLPNDQNFIVDFSSPPDGPGKNIHVTSINIIFERGKDPTTTTFPAHKYQISKISSSDFYNDTVISVTVNEKVGNVITKHREYLYAYEDADLVSNLDGDIAYYGPHILLLKPTGVNSRWPRVIVPIKNNDTFNEPGWANNNNNNNPKIETHSANVKPIASNDLKWENCNSLNVAAYDPTADGHFESEITNTNGKKKFKVKDKHYVQQPGVILEKVIEALKNPNNAKKIKDDFGQVLNGILKKFGLEI